MAKEGLVLMIVSLTSSCKLPIANFMIAGNLTNYMYKTVYKINLLMIYRFVSSEKANLVQQAILKLHNTNVEVLVVTCDRPAGYISMMKELEEI